MTDAMTERAQCLGAEWKDEGDGYFSLTGRARLGFRLVYVALPEGHQDIGTDYDNVGDPVVNGGLTFSESNVFGWDYGHYQNDEGEWEAHIQNALGHFRSRAVVVPS